MSRVALIAGILLLLSSCAGGADVSGDRRVVGDAQIAFSIKPSRVQVGKTVRFTLRVTNNGGRAEVLRFDSGKLYDFWVTDGDREVWRWSDDQVFSQALEERSVPTQDSLTFAENWTATGSGELIAHGLLTSEGFDRELTGKVTVGG